MEKKLLLNNRQTLRNKKIPKMWGDFFFKCKTMLHVKPYSMSLPFGIMRNIWVYLLLLGETGQRTLLKLKNGFGVICKVGRKSCCLKLVGRLWLRQWSNLSWFIQWVFLSFWLVFVKILKPWSENFGGAMVM